MFYQKLVIPNVVSYALVREDILHRLDETTSKGRTILVIGPAGWGKTTTLATWAHKRSANRAVAWYSLDSSDRDFTIFVRYLLTALAPYCPPLQPIIEQISSEIEYDRRRLLIEQSVAVLGALPTHVSLILDDLHVILDATSERTQPMLEFLDRLIRYAPHLHIIIASRTALPNTIRHRVQEMVEVFNRTTLAFTADDVLALAQARHHVTLTHAQATKLVQWVQGWPVAVILGLEEWKDMITDGADPSEQISPHTTINSLYLFLVEQVFAPLPQPLQTFLIETSVLDRLSRSCCDALRGADDSAIFLADIQHHHLPVELQAEWMSYHDLFRNFLLSLLNRSTTRAQALTQRAAELYEEWDEPHAAFSRWMKLGRIDAASTLALNWSQKLVRRGEHATVIGWIEELRMRAPVPVSLSVRQAHAAIEIADWTTAYSALQHAKVSSDPDAAIEALLLEILIACMRKQISRSSELLAAIQLETLPPHFRGRGYEMAGRVALLQGRNTEAIIFLKQALTTCTDNPGPDTDANRLAHLYDLLGMALSINNERAEADYYLHFAKAAWQSLGYTGRQIITLNNLGVNAIEEGRLDEAVTHLKEGLSLAQRLNHPRGQVVLQCSLGDLALIQTLFDEAEAYYTAAATLARQLQMQAELVYACACALRVGSLSGNKANIQRWEQAVHQISTTSITPVNAMLIALARALATEDLQSAARLIDSIPHVSSLALHDRVQILLLCAQITYTNHGAAAAAPLWEALEQEVTGRHLDALLRVQVCRTKGLMTAMGDYPLVQRLRDQSESRSQHWELYALGGFEARRSEDSEPIPMRPVDQLVLVRLIEAGPVGLPVLTLWDDIWGDQPFSSDAVRQSLSRIRRKLGLAIRLHMSHCQIQTPQHDLLYDVRSFEAPLQDVANSVELRQHFALYKGAFMGHLRSESRWLEMRRTLLHRHALFLREALARTLEHCDPHEAIRLYSNVLGEDSCREAAAAGVMRCAMNLGERALAIATYQQICNSLLDNLGADPSPDLTLLYQQVA